MWAHTSSHHHSGSTHARPDGTAEAGECGGNVPSIVTSISGSSSTVRSSDTKFHHLLETLRRTVQSCHVSFHLVIKTVCSVSFTSQQLLHATTGEIKTSKSNPIIRTIHFSFLSPRHGTARECRRRGLATITMD